jgi:hypothetical protein
MLMAGGNPENPAEYSKDIFSERKLIKHLFGGYLIYNFIFLLKNLY